MDEFMDIIIIENKDSDIIQFMKRNSNNKNYYYYFIIINLDFEAIGVSSLESTTESFAPN